MGSMQKIMQKLRAKSGESADASNTALPEETQNSQTAAPVGPPADSASAFTPDPAGTQASASNIVDDRTIEWDASKLDQTLVTFHERYSAVSEQYRSLRARLLNMNPQHKHQIIAITSSLPQEGKSVTTINLSTVMAEGNEHKVLLIDADFRRASIARMLGITPRPGLAELIRGKAQLSEVLRPTPFPNLKIITAGGASDKKYGELLGASAVRTVFTQFHDHFDFTFLDTPPVNTVSDVSMLAPHCDGLILVIEMRRTPEPSIQEAVRTLQTTNVKVLGCLLSQYNDQRGHYYERYYSYYYNND